MIHQVMSEVTVQPLVDWNPAPGNPEKSSLPDDITPLEFVRGQPVNEGFMLPGVKIIWSEDHRRTVQVPKKDCNRPPECFRK